MLGNGRLEAMCFDGEKRLAHIRGKLRKKVWINQGDIILLSLRDYQDEKGDVILKYTADEARNLKAYGELPENAKINETDTYGLPPARSSYYLNSVLTHKCRPRGRRRVQLRVRSRGWRNRHRRRLGLGVTITTQRSRADRVSAR
jgi:translation initiation factor 1A